MKVYATGLIILFLVALPVHGYHTSGTFQKLDHTDISFSSYEGQPVVIEAIQTDCSHCNDPAHRERMNVLYNNYNDRVTFLLLTINDYDTVDDMNNFIDKFDIQWTAGFDNNDELSNQFSVTGTPTTILLDEEGRHQNTWVGHQEIQVYVNALNRVLGEDKTIEDTFQSSSGGSSQQSLVEKWLTNPLVQVTLITVVLIMIYMKSIAGNSQIAA